MLNQIVAQLKSVAAPILRQLRDIVLEWTKPMSETLVGGSAQDVVKTKSELLVENALLRQQLIVLKRQVKRPELRGRDRFLLVALASKLRHWRQALLVVKPETLLRWHRELFRLIWKRKSAAPARKPRVPAEAIALIRKMAQENKLWGAERIQGELLKLNIKLAKRTIQKYMRMAQPARSGGQTWATFLKNHASHIWACDFLPVVDFAFQHLYAFFIVEHGSRRVVHVGVTRHPTDAWVAQQLREATPFGEHPRYLIRDNDSKFGAQFARVAVGSGITILKTPFHAPKANAICERFLGSVRRECLDHFLILSESHLQHILQEYVAYFNQERPHQGIAQQLPAPREHVSNPVPRSASVQSRSFLGGLHHAYQRVA